MSRLAKTFNSLFGQMRRDPEIVPLISMTVATIGAGVIMAVSNISIQRVNKERSDLAHHEKEEELHHLHHLQKLEKLHKMEKMPTEHIHSQSKP